MKIVGRLLAFLMGFISFNAGAGSLLTVSHFENLSQSERINAVTLINETESKLPESVRNLLPSKIEIEFESDLGATLGYVKSFRSSKIAINKSTLNWLPGSKVGIEDINQNNAVKNLIHEIGHILDHSSTPSLPLNLCMKTKGPSTNGINLGCKIESLWKTAYSSDPRFIALVQRSYLSNFESINNANKALPVSYSFKTNEEAFATTFSYFFSDPEFGCRLPALAIYFSEKFNIPDPTLQCAPNLTWVSATVQKVQEIDIARTKAIDILWAEGNNNFVSKHGHIMLRLVVCKTEYDSLEECYSNYKEHIVLSYAGSPKEYETDLFDAISDYVPLNLFAFSMTEKVNEYAIEELRDIYSAPLKLSPQQRKALLYHLNNEHWNLDGEYRFLDQNCNTESINALIAAGVDLSQIVELYSPSPKIFFNNLLKSDLSGVKSLDEIKASKFLFFPSLKKSIDAALKKALQIFPNKKFSNIPEYIDQVSTSEVNALMERNSLNREMLYALLITESQRKIFISANLRNNFLKSKQEMSKQQRIFMDELTQLVKASRLPKSSIPNASYGIPSMYEISHFSSDSNRAAQENVSVKILALDAEIESAIQGSLKESVELISRLKRQILVSNKVINTIRK